MVSVGASEKDEPTVRSSITQEVGTDGPSHPSGHWETPRAGQTESVSDGAEEDSEGWWWCPGCARLCLDGVEEVSERSGWRFRCIRVLRVFWSALE